MAWLFNTFIQWLVGLILDLTCSIMGWFSEGLGGLFSTSNFFDRMFFGTDSAGESAIIKLFLTVGITLCFAFVLMGIVRSIISGMGWTGERPIKMIGRLAIGAFLCFSLYGFLKSFIFGGTDTIFYSIFKLSEPAMDILKSPVTSGDSSIWDAMGSVGAGLVAGLALSILLVFLSIAILTNFIKLLLELFERYILVNVLFMFAPLAPAALVLESTTKVFQSYLKFIFGQLMILWLGNIFLALGIGALEFAATLLEHVQAIGSVLALFAVLAFLKIFQRLDNYMRDVGLLVGITGGSLLEEIYAASKTFNSFKKGGKKSGGTGAVGGVAAVAGAAGAANVLSRAGSAASAATMMSSASAASESFAPVAANAIGKAAPATSVASGGKVGATGGIVAGSEITPPTKSVGNLANTGKPRATASKGLADKVRMVGVGGYAASRLTSGAMSFGKNYSNLRGEGQNMFKAIHKSSIAMKENLKGAGTDISHALVSPGVRADFKDSYTVIKNRALRVFKQAETKKPTEK